MQIYSLKPDGGLGASTVLVDREMAGRVIACDKHPGLCRIKDQNGEVLGRAGLREQGAEFLAAWFFAEDQD